MRRFRPLFGGLAAFAPIVALAYGCAPTCEVSCRKVLECGLSDRLAYEECTLSCERQIDLYETWDDREKEAAFREHRWCLQQSTCEEITDGACYDETLFPF